MTSTDYYNNNNNDHDYNDHDKGSPTPAAAHEYDLLVSSIPNEKPKISLDFDRFNNLVSPYDSDVEFMNQDAIVASPLNLETNQVEWISHSHSFENNTQFPFDINHNNDSNNNIQNDDDNDKLDSGGSMSNHHHQQDHVHSPTTPEPSSSTSHIQQEPIIVTDIKVNNSIEYNNEQSILSNNDGIYNKTTKKPTDKLPVPAPPSPSLSSSSISQYEKNNNNSSNKNISHNLSPSSSTTTSSFEMIDPKMTQIIADPSSSTQYNNKITSSNLSSKPSASAEERASWIPVRVLGPSIPMMVEGKGKGLAVENHKIGFAHKMLEARKQQEKKWRLETRERAEKERQLAMENQPQRTVTERRLDNDHNDDDGNTSSRSLSDEQDIWIQEEEPQQQNNQEERLHEEIENEIMENDNDDEQEKEDDAEEATRLLLNQLEYQDRETQDLMDPIFNAIHARFTFEPHIDTHQAIHHIVDHLLSIKPFDQWDTILALDLSDPRYHITKISDLDTLLPALTTLNVSNNAISDMPRLPPSLQTLKAKSNRITNITAFEHLHNLHYLDICNNAISSFEGITSLYHLRTLHAEYNKVASCRPFKRMKGLIHLNLRNNSITQLNFRKIKMDSLETLDLAYNRVECLEAIEGLTNLKVLNLDHNDIKWIQVNEPMEKLKVLRMSYNRLKTFDPTFFPDLRTLYLDDNQIQRIIGLSCTPRISSFSLRDQGGQQVNFNLQYLRGSRKMYLSGNSIVKELHRMEDFFTLEYLELCSIQLDQLPKDFARHVPNLGVLYLSHNYLQDVRPLRKLRHLQKLVLMDNKLDSEGDVIDAVRPLKRLRYLDLRQNPLSVKLYPPIKSIEQCKLLKNGISCFLANEYDETWTSRDAHFSQHMESQWHERRKVHRALFIKCQPLLQVLDNISITDEERTTADIIASELKHKQTLLQ